MKGLHTGSCGQSSKNYSVIACQQCMYLCSVSNASFIMWLKHLVTLILIALICSNDRNCFSTYSPN